LAFHAASLSLHAGAERLYWRAALAGDVEAVGVVEYRRIAVGGTGVGDDEVLAGIVTPASSTSWRVIRNELEGTAIREPAWAREHAARTLGFSPSPRGAAGSSSDRWSTTIPRRHHPALSALYHA
jgi:hypothetical protein